MKRGKRTREEWLTQMVRILHSDLFKKLPAQGLHHGVSKNLPKFRVSCSWPGGGNARKSIGECWSPSSSKSGHTEMFISPKMSDVVKVVETLVHEMVHMYMFQLPNGLDIGHKRPFQKLAHAVGLEGKMSATNADENLVKVIKRLCRKNGKYPHADMSGLGGRKKQTTRLVKATCLQPDCGAVIRITSTWIDAAEGLLTCPVCEIREMEVG